MTFPKNFLGSFGPESEFECYCFFINLLCILLLMPIVKLLMASGSRLSVTVSVRSCRGDLPRHVVLRCAHTRTMCGTPEILAPVIFDKRGHGKART